MATKPSNNYFYALGRRKQATARVRLSTGKGTIAIFGSGLIAGGAVSNALDRFQYGAVLDFLNFQVFWFYNPYSFNLADVFIFVGVGLLFVASAKK